MEGSGASARYTNEVFDLGLVARLKAKTFPGAGEVLVPRYVRRLDGRIFASEAQRSRGRRAGLKGRQSGAQDRSKQAKALTVHARVDPVALHALACPIVFVLVETNCG